MFHCRAPLISHCSGVFCVCVVVFKAQNSPLLLQATAFWKAPECQMERDGDVGAPGRSTPVNALRLLEDAACRDDKTQGAVALRHERADMYSFAVLMFDLVSRGGVSTQRAFQQKLMRVVHDVIDGKRPSLVRRSSPPLPPPPARAYHRIAWLKRKSHPCAGTIRAHGAGTEYGRADRTLVGAEP